VRSLKPRFARWLLWTSLAVHVPIAVVAAFHARLPDYDFDNFYNIATKPGRPYLDFPVEFPVGTVQVFRTVGSIAGSRANFGVCLVIVSVVADAAIVCALYWGWGIAAATGYALIVIPLIDLFFLRTDLWSTAIATIAVAAWRREQRVAAAIGFAAGAAFKLWPLAFLPLLLVPARGRGRALPIATAMAAGLAVLGGWLWVAGASGLYQVLTFRGARGWEIESTVGAIWMLVNQSSMRVEAGAWRIGRAMTVEHRAGDGLDLAEAVDAHRAGARQAELDAVVFGRVVRRREDGARAVEVAGCEVHHVRRGQPDVDHVDALAADAVGEGGHEGRPGRSHVAADEQLGRPGVAGERHAQRAGHRFVELVGDRPADVVRLDDLVEHSHDGRSG